MVFVIILLCLFLMGSVMTNVYLYQELLDARHRAYCAEEWMDPIAVEEIDTDYMSENPYSNSDGRK